MPTEPRIQRIYEPDLRHEVDALILLLSWHTFEAASDLSPQVTESLEQSVEMTDVSDSTK